MRAMPWLFALMLLAAPARAQRRPARPLATYQTPYYTIHTDLVGDDLREAGLRMTKMAEEYHARTRDFSNAMNQKMPFYLFTREQDYYNAGGQAGTAGFFSAADSKLVAVADPQARPWHTIQHEGFHQFARTAIGGQLPVWVNEGLAEYFGEGLFTGDSFITGVIPPRRLDRVKKQMREKEFRPIKEMMLLAHADWNEEMSLKNYDQAWAMVQFLAHAENGKYQSAFVGFMREIGRGQQWERAWVAAFGSAEGFEQKWQQYWLALPAEPALDLYARSATLTMTSALARATAQQQKFASFDDLLAAAKSTQLKTDSRDWLPPGLINEALEHVAQFRKRGVSFALIPPAGSRGSAIVCTLKDGTKITARFKLAAGRVTEVAADTAAR